MARCYLEWRSVARPPFPVATEVEAQGKLHIPRNIQAESCIVSASFVISVAVVSGLRILTQRPGMMDQSRMQDWCENDVRRNISYAIYLLKTVLILSLNGDFTYQAIHVVFLHIILGSKAFIFFNRPFDGWSILSKETCQMYRIRGSF